MVPHYVTVVFGKQKLCFGPFIQNCTNVEFTSFLSSVFSAEVNPPNGKLVNLSFVHCNEY